MPAPGGSTFNGNVNASPPVTAPYRPGTADFNGIGLANSPVRPPNPATMPTAELLNTQSAMSVVYGRLVAAAIVSVKYAGGNPALDSYTAAPDAFYGAPAAKVFTVARTGGGAANGDISITWPAGALPAQLVQPRASLNVLPGAHSYSIGVVPITNGVRVVTNQDNTATDLAFTVEIT